MTYLLDSDIITHAHHQRYGLPGRIAGVVLPDSVAISVITRIEALRGRFDFVLKAATAPELRRAFDWLEQTEAFLAQFRLLTFDQAAADLFTRFRSERRLNKTGRGDLLIACIALAHDATLVTRNVKDFQLIPNLKVENWAD